MTTHLVKRQKITKRQMKEDPLVTSAGRVMDQWEHARQPILVVAASIVVVGFLVCLHGPGAVQGRNQGVGRSVPGIAHRQSGRLHVRDAMFQRDHGQPTRNERGEGSDALHGRLLMGKGKPPRR